MDSEQCRVCGPTQGLDHCLRMHYFRVLNQGPQSSLGTPHLSGLYMGLPQEHLIFKKCLKDILETTAQSN